MPHLRHGEDFNHPLVANLLLSDGERIGQHLAKLSAMCCNVDLWAVVVCDVLYGSWAVMCCMGRGL